MTLSKNVSVKTTQLRQEGKALLRNVVVEKVL